MTGKSWFASKSAGATAYRSGLEDKIAQQLESKGVPVSFESYFLNYIKPQTSHKYTPDFVLPNGIIIESKGLFDVDDRKKHILIKEQYPDLDIRFVFSRSASKLYKGAKTTYADWCIKHDFQFADKIIPVSWLLEKSKKIPEGVLIPKK